MLHVAAAYHVDDTEYQNVGVGSAPRSRRIYWRAMAVMLASARRAFGSDAQLRVTSNDRPLPEVEPVLARAGVEVVSLPFRYEVPTGYHRQFGGSFHLLDLVRDAAERFDDADQLLILDPDCLVVGAVGPLIERLARVGSLHYPIDYAPDHTIMDMSRLLFQELFAELCNGPVDTPPPYVGGELVGVTGATARRLLPWIDQAWEHSMGRHERGLSKLTTEEGVLSYAFWRLGQPEGRSADLVRRIWTSPLYRNVEDLPVEELVVWHLPGEKNRGFRSLFAAAEDGAGWFWQDEPDAFRHRAGRLTGLDPDVARRLYDLTWRGAYALRAVARRG